MLILEVDEVVGTEKLATGRTWSMLDDQTLMHGLPQFAPNPEGFVNLWLWRFRTPFELAAWWLRG